MCDRDQKRESAMKLAFIVHNEFQSARVMEILRAAGIDYYTRWENVKGKGRGTEPHLGAGSFPSMNSVLMIAFPENEPLDALVRELTAVNAEVRRPDDAIRLFQLPLERMV
jgi:hypothetical protein